VFNNQSGKEFTDISSEQYRVYTFPGGDTVKINNPQQLSVSENGHRLFDAQGVSHYIPMTWIHLEWLAKEGQPNFVK